MQESGLERRTTLSRGLTLLRRQDMKTALRALALVSVSLLLAPSAGALDADGDATVKGAGFFRKAAENGEGKGKGKGKNRQTKTMITVQANDSRSDGSEDGGVVHYMDHTPGGGRGTHLAISLDCVLVDGDTAHMSGTVGDDIYGVKVVDGGTPGKGRDEFGFAQIGTIETLLGILTGDCGAGEVDTEPIHGGNLTVTDVE
jgi:hypothetical protein